MKHKKSLLIICLIICLFSIASVCAGEVNETVVASEDQSDELITIDDIGTTEEKTLSESPGTFTELAEKINNGTEIVLDKDYRFDSAVDTDYQMGVGISKTITLDGKGHTIDGNNGAKLLRITGNNVILKNLIFINSYSDSTHTVGAVSLNGNSILDNCSFININVKYGDSALSASNSIIKNCYFLNNHARDGSTVSLSSTVDVINCTFINNTGSRGGAIITRGMLNNIINCNFINDSADSAAISIFWSNQNNIINCSFINNIGFGGSAIAVAGVANTIENCSFVSNEGADIVAFSSSPPSDDCKLINCYFVNNTSIDDYIVNSIVIFDSFDCLVFNCSFINNTAKNSKTYSTVASAICITGSDGNVSNCFFSDNYAERGGAIYWAGNDGSMSNCIFVDNVASKYAGAIYWTGENGNINNCTFLNNTPKNSYSDSVTVIKKKLSIICSNYSFYYNHLNPISIKLDNVLPDVPVDSPIIFNFTKGNINKQFDIDVINNVASIFDEISDLTVGNWTVTAIFEGDDNYDSCNATFTVTVKPTKSILFVNDVNGTLDKQIILTAYVLDYDNLLINEGMVTFFDGETNIGQSNVKDGVASLSYTPITVGEHTITAIYDSDNYLSSNCTSKITIDKAIPEIEFDEIITVEYSNPTTFTARILYNDKLVKEGVVKFYVDDEEIKSVDNDDGEITFDYIVKNVGLHNVTAIFEESDNYLSSTNSLNFTVDKLQTSIVILNDVTWQEIFHVTYADDYCTPKLGVYTSDVILPDEGSAIPLYERLTNYFAYFNGSTDNVIVNSDGSFYLRNLTVGTYNLFVELNDSNRKGSGNFTFTIDKGYASLSILEITIGYGEYGNSTAITRAASVELGECELYLMSNKDKYKDFIRVDGCLITVLPGLEAGTHFIDFIIKDDNWKSSETCKFKVNVLPADTAFAAINDMSILYGTDSIIVNGKVNGIKYSNYAGNVNVVIGNVNANADVNSDGSFSVKVSRINTLDVGNYSAIVSGESASKNYSSPKNTIFDLSINQAQTSISAYNVNTVYNGGKYLTIALKDDAGKPLNGTSVSVNLNGVKSFKTDSNGQVKVSTNGLAPKTYTATITFAGDINYKKSSTTAKVMVTKATPKLTASAKTFKVNDKTKKYVVTLKTNQNKVMKNTKLTLKVNGKTYSATTNAKGQATFMITKLTKKGKFTAVVKFAGNKYYNAKTVKPKITVK